MHGLGGQLCCLVRQSGWRLRDLQTAIKEATGIGVTEQRLLLGSEVLEELPEGPLCLTLLRLSPGQARFLEAVAQSEPLAPLLAAQPQVSLEAAAKERATEEVKNDKVKLN